jgi:hypothetical protein
MANANVEVLIGCDRSVHSVRLSRHQVRELLKEVAGLYCSAVGRVDLRSSLILLVEGLGDSREAPQLAALLEFARLPGGREGSSRKGVREEQGKPGQGAGLDVSGSPQVGVSKGPDTIQEAGDLPDAL